MIYRHDSAGAHPCYYDNHVMSCEPVLGVT